VLVIDPFHSSHAADVMELLNWKFDERNISIKVTLLPFNARLARSSCC